MAVVQEYIECACWTVLVSTEPGQVSAVGTDPHARRDYCHYGGQDSQVGI